MSKNDEWSSKYMKVCPVCNKEFCTFGYDMNTYMYKVTPKRGQRKQPLCSYTCYSKYKKSCAQ